MGKQAGNIASDLLGLAVVIFVGIYIWNTWIHPPEKWSLVYQDSTNISKMAGNYKTREECREKLHEAKQNHYMINPECGSNCKPQETLLDVYVCDETFEL